MSEQIKIDCRFYQGDRPCTPHKEHGVHCAKCDYYARPEQRILIIKLGAAGDVIRTTPILRKLKSAYPQSHITWLTDFVEFLPDLVDEKLEFSERTVPWLALRSFDLCINLDKDKESIALAEMVKSREKLGFGMDEYGRPRALDRNAEQKLLAGVFDDVSKRNTKSYLQEIFEICGFVFQGEEYLVENRSSRDWDFGGGNLPIIGFNTGCGRRWPSRLWPISYWCELAGKVKQAGMDYVWLGGPEEKERNTEIHEKVGGYYFGILPIDDFVGLVKKCDLVVTQVTMTLHLALGLKRKIVLLNNIFNKNEFELYGRGVVVEPDSPCGCYYTPVCPHDSMKSITPERVFSAIVENLKT